MSFFRFSALILLGTLLMTLPVSAQTSPIKLGNLLGPADFELVIDHPPKLWTELGAVVFAQVSGSCGEELDPLIRREFLAHGVDVVDRAQLETVMQELGLGLARWVDPKTALKVGKMLGARTALVLKLTRCEGDMTFTNSGALSLSGRNVIHYFAKYEFFIKGSVDVIDLETTKIFSTEVFNTSALDETSKVGARPEPPVRHTVKDRALDQAAAEIVRILVPWQEIVTASFFKSSKCGMKDVYRRAQIDEIESALGKARESVTACEGQKAQYRARTRHNLGMLQFMVDNYPAALSSFEEAFDLDADLKIGNLIKVTRRAIETRQKLRAYYTSIGTPLPEPEIQTSNISPSVNAEESEAPNKSLSDRLQEIKEAKEAGLISDEEYQALRADILKGF